MEELKMTNFTNNVNPLDPNGSIVASADQNAKDIGERYTRLKNGCVQVGYDINNWSGTKTLTKANVRVYDDSGALVELDSDMATPGRKALLSKESLSFTNKYTVRMGRLFAKYGVKFCGNWLVPDDLLPQLMLEANVQVNEYYDCVNNFCHNYEHLIQEWVTKHPSLANVIREDMLSVKEVERKFKLKVYPPIRIAPKDVNDMEELLDEATDGVWQSISKEALDIIDTSLTVRTGKLKGTLKDECGHSVVGKQLKRLRDKVNSLSMINEDFDGLVDVLDDLMKNALPDSGRIIGEHFKTLLVYVEMLSDPKRAQLQAKGINQISSLLASDLDYDASAEVVDNVVGVIKTQPVAVEPQPVAVEPQPVAVEPQPVVVEPQPVVVEPQPVVVEPQPVVVEPQPVVVEPQPVVVEPQPVVADVEINNLRDSLISIEDEPEDVDDFVTTEGFFF
ncbi:DUF3150 domain-containing protein [Photobacterium carnosum]|nr:DUF3150 domain-containing protein [Photobacterium phosphoreum]MCD9488894.1 DUF3150 domain-containing protein [Photobacterium iliopiscarium]MCD9546124.1 DUF3150 domain-containing protein [Photobacterium carnosum]MCD9508120.1 DUF3150 domain-containing protein [Photobacterium phosphoreum]MCD9550615.1 DUF3150 domain-containing protein [Photobacterium carnosum]